MLAADLIRSLEIFGGKRLTSLRRFHNSLLRGGAANNDDLFADDDDYDDSDDDYDDDDYYGAAAIRVQPLTEKPTKQCDVFHIYPQFKFVSICYLFFVVAVAAQRQFLSVLNL